MELLISFIAVILLFSVSDGLWLTLIAKKFYQQQLGDLLRPKPLMAPAIVFYALYMLGVLLFVLIPAVEKSNAAIALVYGLIFGLVAYGTYDLTNLSTLRAWPRKVVVVDMIWGAFITGVTSCLAVLISQVIA